MTRAATWVGSAVLAIVAGLLAIELLLQGLHLATAREVQPPADPDAVVVLCVGDSHTWGMGTGYPAALAAKLAQRSSRYHVVNLGVPGSNTAQLRRRFVDYLERFRPRVVILWSGINNSWNRSDAALWDAAGEPDARSWTARLLDASRVVRFVRVWRHQRALDRAAADLGPLLAPALSHGPDENRQTFRRDVMGVPDRQENTPSPPVAEAETTRVTAIDVAWLATTARAHGVLLLAITYPLGLAQFGAANAGIRAGAVEAGVGVVDANEALQRLKARLSAAGQDRSLFDPSLHPTQEAYDEIGALVLERLDRDGLIDP